METRSINQAGPVIPQMEKVEIFEGRTPALHSRSHCVFSVVWVQQNWGFDFTGDANGEQTVAGQQTLPAETADTGHTAARQQRRFRLRPGGSDIGTPSYTVTGIMVAAQLN